MASNIAQQRIQREFREVVKSEEVAASGVQVKWFYSVKQNCINKLIKLLDLFIYLKSQYPLFLQLSLVNDDLTELSGTIKGPPDTPYEGGTYKLEIKIPDTYPFNPPRVRFITKVCGHIQKALALLCKRIKI